MSMDNVNDYSGDEDNDAVRKADIRYEMPEKDGGYHVIFKREDYESRAQQEQEIQDIINTFEGGMNSIKEVLLFPVDINDPNSLLIKAVINFTEKDNKEDSIDEDSDTES